MSAPEPRLVVASNRLPVVVRPGAAGDYRIEPAVGGLVTALLPIMRTHGGTWVGWSGIAGDDAGIDRALDAFAAGEHYRFAPVRLSAQDVQRFYQGFSNEVVWPLFHDLFTNCVFAPDYWQSYRAVNRRFAEVLARELAPDDLVWLHDYHLMNVAAELRALGLEQRIGFFLHVPFPGPDIFLKLPWREQILNGLLACNQIGFQTERDRANFLACTERLAGGASVPDRFGVCLRPGVSHDGAVPEELVVSCHPISIDFDEFAEHAGSPDVAAIAARLRHEFRNRHLILGLDRLDYSKGLPQKLAAFRLMLERHPDLRRSVCLVQHVVPSREDLPGYREQRLTVERLVGEINGAFSEPGWVPVHYYYHTLARDQLLAWYRVADVALITPLKDGMNLVAKEYCACQVEDRGVLVLSEFAGAAAELGAGALTVNPFDVEGVAASLYRALDMPVSERQERMRWLRASIRAADVHRWADRCLAASAQGRCRPEPVPGRSARAPAGQPAPAPDAHLRAG